jgi:hypothetical protein
VDPFAPPAPAPDKATPPDASAVVLPALVPGGKAGSVQTAQLAPTPGPAVEASPRVAPTPSLPTLPALAPRGSGPAGDLASLARRATACYASIDSYIVRLTRREQVGGKNRPEEVLLLKFRKAPWSLYLKWVGNEGKGREMVYVRGQYEGKIHLLTAPGDTPLAPFGGKRLSLSPDKASLAALGRHPLTEMGLGPLVERFGSLVAGAAAGDFRRGGVQYLGLVKRPEFKDRVEGALQTIPPDVERGLPKGGQRWWFFDPQLHLPVLVYTQDPSGHAVEWYCFDRLLFSAHPLGEEEFNPDVLWGQ